MTTPANRPSDAGLPQVALAHGLRLDNRFVRELPGDPEGGSRRRQVEAALWSPVLPTPVSAPRLLAHSAEMAAALGFDDATLASPDFAAVFGGNALATGMMPYAGNYGGHQFGHWAGQLGDGRAITLGEGTNAAGERWELQLKGAGPTPYSRTADGRALRGAYLKRFAQAREALADLGVEGVLLVGVSKGEQRRAGDETLVLADGRELRPGAVSPALQFIQQVRDEAHRFAITGHRGRRQKARTTSRLEDIPGIGPRRRAALLRHFGGLGGLKAAGEEEIARVEGINAALAARIYATLHGLAPPAANG